MQVMTFTSLDAALSMFPVIGLRTVRLTVYLPVFSILVARNYVHFISPFHRIWTLRMATPLLNESIFNLVEFRRCARRE